MHGFVDDGDMVFLGVRHELIDIFDPEDGRDSHSHRDVLESDRAFWAVFLDKKMVVSKGHLAKIRGFHLDKGHAKDSRIPLACFLDVRDSYKICREKGPHQQSR